MFIKSLFAAALAAIGFSAFGFDQPAYDATYTTNGITYAQRGGLGVKDFVVTNIDASAVGKVKSVNGRVGDVVLDAAAVNALPDDKDELVRNDNFKEAVVTNALTVATTNRVAALETATGNLSSSVSSLASSKADQSALTAHTENTDNPHGVTAEQVGAVPFVADKYGNKTAVTIGSRIHGGEIGERSIANGYEVIASEHSSHAEGYSTTASGEFSHAEGSATTASGYSSHAEGYSATASGDFSHAEGYLSQTKEEDIFAFAWNGDDSKTEEDPYKSNGPGTFNINPLGGLDGFYIGDKQLSAIILGSVTNNISATNPTFSNAVLAVGLNIDTNSVAVLNEIADTFDGFPIEGTATTVGGLLAALAAAAAWLKKNKVGSFASVGGATATVENGVAKLDDFFTESDGLKKLKNALLESAIGTMTKTDAEGSEDAADATNAVTLNDNSPMTVTIATETADALAVTFADARQTGGLRICELYILNGTASTDLTFDAAVQFVGTGDSFPACDAGINYFVFAEIAANKWKVARETLKTITTPVAAA